MFIDWFLGGGVEPKGGGKSSLIKVYYKICLIIILVTLDVLGLENCKFE
jgi:hypothetical protein